MCGIVKVLPAYGLEVVSLVQAGVLTKQTNNLRQRGVRIVIQQSIPTMEVFDNFKKKLLIKE